MTNTSDVTKVGTDVVTQGIRRFNNGTITKDNVIIVASIITIGSLIAIHDLIVHGYGAEGEYDPETKKASVKIKPNAYYEKAV
ncbi:hypothetical protein [Lacrimispora aerotolerans]|uniref:hypothetical protein n=1 Tax=Lacrimispora aerotolerans TaxID=36832 RepID=UPI00047E76E3|nr:hypothetical protein [Lacrimispora aerotolerans]